MNETEALDSLRSLVVGEEYGEPIRGGFIHVTPIQTVALQNPNIPAKGFTGFYVYYAKENGELAKLWVRGEIIDG